MSHRTYSNVFCRRKMYNLYPKIITVINNFGFYDHRIISLCQVNFLLDFNAAEYLKRSELTGFI